MRAQIKGEEKRKEKKKRCRWRYLRQHPKLLQTGGSEK